jgi:hypothetical protein
VNTFIVAYQATSDVKLGDEEWRPDLEKRLDAIRNAARTSCLPATPATRSQ